MNKEYFVRILAGVCKLYGREMDKETMELWLTFFKENTTVEFKQAVNDHIKTSKYFPTVADIKEKIYELRHQSESDMELWEKLLTAIRNGSYHAEEEFEKLPMVVQEFIRNPRQLQEYAIMDSEIIYSVVKGQFLKQIKEIKEYCKEKEIAGNLIGINERKYLED